MAGLAAGPAVVPVVDAVPMAVPAVVPVVDAVPMAVPAAGPAVDVVPMAGRGGVPTVDVTPVDGPAAGLTAGRAIEAVQAAGSTTDPIWIVDAGGPTLQVPRVGAGWPGVAPAA